MTKDEFDKAIRRLSALAIDMECNDELDVVDTLNHAISLLTHAKPTGSVVEKKMPFPYDVLGDQAVGVSLHPASEAQGSVVEAPRPMTGFFATLTDEQKKAALEYTGDDTTPASEAQGESVVVATTDLDQDGNSIERLIPKAEFDAASEAQGGSKQIDVVQSVPWACGCATEGCSFPATVYFERGGVGSYFCQRCYLKVQALAAAPSQKGPGQ